MDESRCAPPEKRNRTKSGGLCRARRECGGVGLFFFKGTLRITLHRFFAATGVILMLVAFQLALTGLHELSEARWLPSSKQEMALIGPIVRNELFFFVFVFGAAALF